MSKTYSPAFKLQVVLEGLQADRTDAEIPRDYDVHRVKLSNWKKKLKDNRVKAFGGDNELTEIEKKLANLERTVGQKGGEIAPLKPFLARTAI